MFSSAFWKASFERAVKSFAQALIAFWGADAFNIVEADWGEALALAGGAAVLSILTSIVSSAVTDSPGPSLNNSEVLS